MSASRLGAPVELPWWVIPLALPPAGVAIAGVLVPVALWAHLLAVLSSLATLGAVLRVSTRVSSGSMQSVWISAVYAVWVFLVITWVVVAATTPTCRCG